MQWIDILWISQLSLFVFPCKCYFRRHLTWMAWCIADKNLHPYSMHFCIQTANGSIHLVWFLSAGFVGTDFERKTFIICTGICVKEWTFSRKLSFNERCRQQLRVYIEFSVCFYLIVCVIFVFVLLSFAPLLTYFHNRKCCSHFRLL